MVDTVSSVESYGDPATRKRILDVALDLAAELGPSMRLADVSAGAGISHQGLYLHFGGRNGLLEALLGHMVESFEINQRYSEVTEAVDALTAMEKMVGFLGFMNERLDSIGWVLEEAQYLDEAFGEDYRRRVSGLRAAIETDTIIRLADEGLLRPEWSTSDATDLFLALTTLGTWRELTRELGWTPAEYEATTLRLLRTSLLRDPG